MMKYKYALLILAAGIQPALAQSLIEEQVIPPPPLPGGVIRETIVERTPSGDIVTEIVVPAPPPEIIRETIVEPTPPRGVVSDVVVPITPPPAFDPAFARRHLLVAPRPVVVPQPLPGTVVVPRPPSGTVVETIETKNIVDLPGQPGRVYDVERNVVIVEGKELSYITIPVLFEKETAKLLDVESRVALEATAVAILEVLKTQPTAVFDIEGHTSTDGTNEFNLTLSADRARRTHQELTQRYLVPPAALTAHGYGEMFPAYPAGTEEQMMQDRRVLIVRKQ